MNEVVLWQGSSTHRNFCRQNGHTVGTVIYACHWQIDLGRGYKRKGGETCTRIIHNLLPLKSRLLLRTVGYYDNGDISDIHRMISCHHGTLLVGLPSPDYQWQCRCWLSLIGHGYRLFNGPGLWERLKEHDCGTQRASFSRLFLWWSQMENR